MCGNVSDSFINMDSGFENRDPSFNLPIRKPNRHIKKLRFLVEEDEVDLWSTDEVHFQLHGSRCRMWIPPEELDPIYFHCPTRKSIRYFGAVRLRDGKFIYQRSTEPFNGETFLQFMKFFRTKSCHSGRKVVVTLDNAKYHHAKLHEEWREERQDRFALDFLPPYSPKLNMIERVWKLTRRLRTHNVSFTDVEQIAYAVESQFEIWANPNDSLRRLCAIT